MYDYKKLAAEAAADIRKNLMRSSHEISMQEQALAILFLANEVTINVTRNEPIARSIIENALQLAKEEKFEDISHIVTENIQCTVEKNEYIDAKLFLNQAINYASKKVRDEEKADYFKVIKEGFESLYYFVPNINWAEIVKFQINEREK